MYSREDLLDAARQIDPKLEELLGPDAGSVRAQLRTLLDQASLGVDVEEELGGLLGADESTRTWMVFYLRRDLSPQTPRGPEGPPGVVGVVPGQLFACPTAGCQREWRCREIGQIVPICDRHHKALVPSKAS